MAQIDERTKVRVSQTLKKNLQKQQAWGGASTVRRRGEVSGTASSVAFTPLQVCLGNKSKINSINKVKYYVKHSSLFILITFIKILGSRNCQSSSSGKTS